MAKDIVCGMNVSENSEKSQYNGEAYYFCCTGCKGLFDREPEKYVKK